MWYILFIAIAGAVKKTRGRKCMYLICVQFMTEFNLILIVLRISESCIKIKVKFLFSRFFVVAQKDLWRLLQGLHKTLWGIAKMCENKNLTVFFSLSGIGTRRVKGALSDLRQFLATESSLKNMKNAFYLNLKAFFLLKLFKLLSWLFDHVAKRLNKKDKFNFKFHDVTAWLTNNCNTHISQYLEK